MESSNKSNAVREYKQAFDEFFRDKPDPKSEEESRKMLEEFFHWYNDVRKQSDTGKTPSEMYKEIYGEEPSEPVELTDEEADEEELGYIREFFNNKIWPKMKKDLKEATKKDACFLCFFAGRKIAHKEIEEELEKASERFGNMHPEEIARMLAEKPKDL